MSNCFFIKPIFVFSAGIFLSCGTVKVYEDPDKPLFISNDITNIDSVSASSVAVLSFNIAKAEKIEMALAELQAFTKTTPVDIYVLQEMDEDGVKFMAKELGLNYLYIPSVYNKLLKKNIGNAILTKGLISHQQKVMLPHKKWVNGRRRHVVMCDVNLRGKNIRVFSVHTETSTMARHKRMAQLDAIIEQALLNVDRFDMVFVGGDFNTLFPKDAKEAIQKFDNAGFTYATASAGHTATAFFGLIKPREDFIFYKGGKLVNSGKILQSKASDHLPIYAVINDSL